MPSTMIHLLMAHKLRPDAGGLFLTGCFAPDAIDVRPGATRADKDRLHLRSEADRLTALKALMCGFDMKNPFLEGYVQHLFLDTLWDRDAYERYRAHDGRDSWFQNYRTEISLAGAYLFHHMTWSAESWRRVMTVRGAALNPLGDPSDADIAAYAARVYAWHSANAVGPSAFFTPAYVEQFTDMAAEKYLRWLEA